MYCFNFHCSIEFDCDDELFATAGVSRRIKVFDFSSVWSQIIGALYPLVDYKEVTGHFAHDCICFDFQVVNEPADLHCPVVEMSTRSKLSCLSWNKFVKNHIASSDYEGIVTVWDVNTRQVIII